MKSSALSSFYPSFGSRIDDVDAVADAVDNDNSGMNDGGAVAVGNNENSSVLSHRPAHLILQNPNLPEWVKNYATWHSQQRTL